jgi:hypothetical protein
MIKRRPGIERIGVGTGGTHLAMSFAVQGNTGVWRPDGNQALVFWDKKFLYTYSTGIWNKKVWGYNTGSLNTIGTLTVNGVGTGWLTTSGAAKLRAGDFISFGAPRSGQRIITQINSNTRLIVNAAPGGAGAGSSYLIKRAFGLTSPYLLDYAVVDGNLVMCDSVRQAYGFTGSVLSEWAATYPTAYAAPGKIVPSCISFFNNRTWLGRIVETLTAGGTTDWRQRIRWSRVTAHSNFQDTSGADTQYIDLPYSSGWLMRLVPLGDMMAAYFSDALYFGVATNMPVLPLMFNRIDTGGIGLVGMGAVCSFLGTQFFVGDDDIYMVRSQGVERIGTPVISKTIRSCSYPQNIRVVPDPLNDRVCFGFPESSEGIVKIWSYFYKAKAWSYDEINCTSLGILSLTSGPTWDTLPSFISPSTWDGGLAARYESWDSMRFVSQGFRLCLGRSDGRVFQMSLNGSIDEPGDVVPVRLEFPDDDYDDADTEKCWIRLGLKVRENVASDITFLVETSTNRGSTYKNVGNLVIRTGEDEGYVNFRTSGAMLRVRLTSSAVVAPYQIVEAVLRVRGKGLETRAVAS